MYHVIIEKTIEKKWEDAEKSCCFLIIYHYIRIDQCSLEHAKKYLDYVQIESLAKFQIPILKNL